MLCKSCVLGVFSLLDLQSFEHTAIEECLCLMLCIYVQLVIFGSSENSHLRL